MCVVCLFCCVCVLLFCVVSRCLFCVPFAICVGVVVFVCVLFVLLYVGLVCESCVSVVWLLRCFITCLCCLYDLFVMCVVVAFCVWV